MSANACTTCRSLTHPNRERWQVQELVKVGCEVRYLNDSYRLNGLKATATQQVRLTPPSAAHERFLEGLGTRVSL